MKKHTVEPGMRFGRLTILQLSDKKGLRNRQIFTCRCDCGKIRDIPRGSITSGDTTSCGCYGRERKKEQNKTHGMRYHPINSAWRQMKSRCKSTNPHTANSYLDRGITVCEEWNDFMNFYNDMAPTWKPGLWLERRDNDLGYSRFNCKWATPTEQQRNKRSNRLLEFEGKTKTVSEWAETIGIPKMTLFSRLGYGWTVDKALTHPIRQWPGPINPCD